MIYQALQVEVQRNRQRSLAKKAAEAERKLNLCALDNILTTLEELNLKDRSVVPDDVVEQLLTFGIPYQPGITIPDLIELVFTKQEQYMNVEPEEANRVPTLEELEAYFEETEVA